MDNLKPSLSLCIYIPRLDPRCYLNKYETPPPPPQLVPVLAQSDGPCRVEERVFESRLGYVSQLQLMGARIRVLPGGCEAVVEGEDGLRGADVEGGDLRASAALVLAALGAQGEESIIGIMRERAVTCSAWGSFVSQVFAGLNEALPGVVFEMPTCRRSEPGVWARAPGSGVRRAGGQTCRAWRTDPEAWGVGEGRSWLKMNGNQMIGDLICDRRRVHVACTKSTALWILT